MLKIMLVDDHPVFRNGLKTLVNSDPVFEVVSETDNASDAFKQYDRLKPDLCIVDVTLKDSSGLDLIKNIRDCHADAKILVVSMHAEDFYAERSLKAGAKGYVMKEQASEDILKALHTIAQGQIYLSPRMMNRLLSKTYGHNKEFSLSPIDSLTDREIEVLQMISDGKSVKEIASALGLSHKTVETHRSHIMHKLGIGTSNELLQFAIHWKIGRQT